MDDSDTLAVQTGPSRRGTKPITRTRRTPSRPAEAGEVETWEEFATKPMTAIWRRFIPGVKSRQKQDDKPFIPNQNLPAGGIAGAVFPTLVRTTSFNAADRSLGVAPDPFVLLRKLAPIATARAFIRRNASSSSSGPTGLFTAWDPYWIELRGVYLLLFKEQMEPDSWTSESDSKLKHIAALGPGTTVTRINPNSKNEAIKIKRQGYPAGSSLHIRLASSYPAAEWDAWERKIVEAAPAEEPTLADFEVIAPIGKGAAGKVFLVKHRATSATLALKVIDKDASVFDCQSSFRHAVDERLLMELTDGHPFFVQLRYAFQTRNKLYLVSEFCEGGDLFYFLHINQRPLREPEARRVLAEVLMALEKLHQLGFVYRDLKPENVLLDSRGHVRLADFGLCKRLEGGRKLGRTHTICGTHAYVAPEMIGAKSYGVSVDMWTLGIFLYHILVGRPPLDARSLDDVKQNLADWDIKYYSEVMTPATLALLRGLMEMDPMVRQGCSAKQGILELRRHPFFSQVDWDEVAARNMEEGCLFPEQTDSTEAGNPSNVLRNFNPSEWAHVELDPDRMEDRFRDRGLWPPVALEKRPVDARFIIGYDFVSRCSAPPVTNKRHSVGENSSTGHVSTEA